MFAHKLDKKWRQNAQKQALDIRRCLIQAREYKDASQSASLATRPVLLYYSLLSLALAQILFKGDGDSSLTRAREENAHHGLLFLNAGYKKEFADVKSALSFMRVKPMIANGVRKGTFDLWHRVTGEDPLVGRLTQYTGVGSIITNAKVICTTDDKRMQLLPDKGLSLFECLETSPCMLNWFNDRGIPSKIVRGTAQQTINPDASSTFHLAIHPHSTPRYLAEFQNEIKVHARHIDQIIVNENQGCFTIIIQLPAGERGDIFFPKSSMWNNEEIRFMPYINSLNEFGLFYIVLFMVSNIARYYPDIWISEIDNYSPLAAALETFLFHAEARMALLTLSELSLTYFTRDKVG